MGCKGRHGFWPEYDGIGEQTLVLFVFLFHGRGNREFLIPVSPALRRVFSALKEVILLGEGRKKVLFTHNTKPAVFHSLFNRIHSKVSPVFPDYISKAQDFSFSSRSEEPPFAIT